jgi:hypothetical protein
MSRPFELILTGKSRDFCSVNFKVLSESYLPSFVSGIFSSSVSGPGCGGARPAFGAGGLSVVPGAGVGCWGPSLGIGNFLACATKSITLT